MESVSNGYPKLAEAAEAINQAMTSLLTEDVIVNVDDSRQYSAYLMAFGSHSCWITSYIMASSGHLDSGWSEIRRAIEFVCYASKVAGDKRRALAWIKQRTDIRSRKSFIASCSIPLNYTDEKYKFLRQLIIAYDIASYFGSHANLETLGHKYHGVEKDKIKLTYQSDIEYSALDAGFIVLLGFRLLVAFRKILKPSLVNKKTIESVGEYVRMALISSRLDFASRKYGKEIPYNIVRFVYDDNQDEINEMFNKLIDDEVERKKIKDNKEDNKEE